MSVGEVAGLLCAVALLLLVALVAVPLLKLGRMLDAGTKRVEQSAQIIDEAVERLRQGGTTIDAVNANLGNVERTTGNVESITHNVKAITGVFSATFGGPLVKGAALLYGLQRATRLRRMIRRTFWLGLGIGMGVTATRKVSSLMPRRVAERQVRNASKFWGDVRSGMRDREDQLRTDFGLGGAKKAKP